MKKKSTSSKAKMECKMTKKMKTILLNMKSTMTKIKLEILSKNSKKTFLKILMMKGSKCLMKLTAEMR
jgi:hypothetical protein